MISQSEYQRMLRQPYVDEHGNIVRSSRTTPNPLVNIPIGTWRYDDEVKTHYGRLVEQLRLFNPKDLKPSEGMNVDIANYEADPMKRGDIPTYIRWIREGKTPPPIEVMEMENGQFEIIDGHRRWAAALKTHTPIRAWVSYLMDGETMRPDGTPVPVPMAIQME